MKTYIVILFSFIGLHFTSAQNTNSEGVIEISADYANLADEPIKVVKDTPYIFRTPEVYLVNSMSFFAMKSFYETIRQEDETSAELLKNYEQVLLRNFELEKKLTNNFVKTDSLDNAIYTRSLTTLESTQKVLDYTVKSLGSATKSLDIVEKNLKKQKRKQTWEKILFVFGGVGAGILVGVSL